MVKVNISGKVVEFESMPSAEDIDEVAKTIGIKPPEEAPKENILQKVGRNLNEMLKENPLQTYQNVQQKVNALPKPEGILNNLGTILMTQFPNLAIPLKAGIEGTKMGASLPVPPQFKPATAFLGGAVGSLAGTIAGTSIKDAMENLMISGEKRTAEEVKKDVVENAKLDAIISTGFGTLGTLYRGGKGLLYLAGKSIAKSKGAEGIIGKQKQVMKTMDSTLNKYKLKLDEALNNANINISNLANTVQGEKELTDVLVPRTASKVGTQIQKTADDIMINDLSRIEKLGDDIANETVNAKKELSNAYEEFKTPEKIGIQNATNINDSLLSPFENDTPEAVQIVKALKENAKRLKIIKATRLKTIGSGKETRLKTIGSGNATMADIVQFRKQINDIYDIIYNGSDSLKNSKIIEYVDNVANNVDDLLGANFKELNRKYANISQAESVFKVSPEYRKEAGGEFIQRLLGGTIKNSLSREQIGKTLFSGGNIFEKIDINSAKLNKIIDALDSTELPPFVKKANEIRANITKSIFDRLDVKKIEDTLKYFSDNGIVGEKDIKELAQAFGKGKEKLFKEIEGGIREAGSKLTKKELLDKLLTESKNRLSKQKLKGKALLINQRKKIEKEAEVLADKYIRLSKYITKADFGSMLPEYMGGMVASKIQALTGLPIGTPAQMLVAMGMASKWMPEASYATLKFLNSVEKGTGELIKKLPLSKQLQLNKYLTEYIKRISRIVLNNNQ